MKRHTTHRPFLPPSHLILVIAFSFFTIFISVDIHGQNRTETQKAKEWIQYLHYTPKSKPAYWETKWDKHIVELKKICSEVETIRVNLGPPKEIEKYITGKRKEIDDLMVRDTSWGRVRLKSEKVNNALLISRLLDDLMPEALEASKSKEKWRIYISVIDERVSEINTEINKLKLDEKSGGAPIFEFVGDGQVARRDVLEFHKTFYRDVAKYKHPAVGLTEIQRRHNLKHLHFKLSKGDEAELKALESTVILATSLGSQSRTELFKRLRRLCIQQCDFDVLISHAVARGASRENYEAQRILLLNMDDGVVDSLHYKIEDDPRLERLVNAYEEFYKSCYTTFIKSIRTADSQINSSGPLAGNSKESILAAKALLRNLQQLATEAVGKKMHRYSRSSAPPLELDAYKKIKENIQNYDDGKLKEFLLSELHKCFMQEWYTRIDQYYSSKAIVDFRDELDVIRHRLSAPNQILEEDEQALDLVKKKLNKLTRLASSKDNQYMAMLDTIHEIKDGKVKDLIMKSFSITFRSYEINEFRPADMIELMRADAISTADGQVAAWFKLLLKHGHQPQDIGLLDLLKEYRNDQGQIKFDLSTRTNLHETSRTPFRFLFRASLENRDISIYCLTVNAHNWSQFSQYEFPPGMILADMIMPRNKSTTIWPANESWDNVHIFAADGRFGTFRREGSLFVFAGLFDRTTECNAWLDRYVDFQAMKGLYMSKAIIGVQRQDGFELGKGAALSRVYDNMPAAQAGLKGGDVVVELDNSPIGSFGDLTEMISNLEPGDRVPVVVMRRGERVKLEIVIGSASDLFLPWK